uniref:Ig-like domain-containing protein n=1 Tax=Gadus morhua TaxID=8049 RepID=A0A8C5CPN8_GADMO
TDQFILPYVIILMAYPDSFCVVEGSTATIPCSFTHPKVHERTGVVVERVERVVWCTNNEFCLTTANVHGSSNLIVAQRFQYLGDRVRKCTLKIIKTVKQDAATYRFRFETNADKYAGRKGVVVTVTDGEVVKVRSSVTDHVVKEGGQVPLTCTSACSFDQLDVHWYRNGHALSETGPALHPSNLTNGDTGNYTCSLDSSWQKTSAPWCLVVMESELLFTILVSTFATVQWVGWKTQKKLHTHTHTDTHTHTHTHTHTQTYRHTDTHTHTQCLKQKQFNWYTSSVALKAY